MTTALYELYDSDEPLAIPLGVHAAGYDDGEGGVNWTRDNGWARFPDALHITIFGLPQSDAFDIETGGGLPGQAGPWAAGKRSQRKIGIVYVNRSNGHAAEDSLRGSGLSVAEVMLWIATDDGTEVVTHWLDGTPVTYPVWAVQYLTESTGSGGHYDRSLVYLAFGGGSGTIGGVQDMYFPRDPGAGTIWAVYEDQAQAQTVKRHLSPAQWEAYASSGATFHDLDGTGLAAVEALPDAVPASGGGGTEPPEPAEPKVITLNITSIPGTATGTLQ